MGNKPLSAAALLVLLLIFLNGCATAPTTPDGKREVRRMLVTAYDAGQKGHVQNSLQFSLKKAIR